MSACDPRAGRAADQRGPPRGRERSPRPNPPGRCGRPASVVQQRRAVAPEGEWRLFTDWCHATGHSPIPATADTVRQFLADLPAPPAVTARRARAVRHAHHAAGLLTAGGQDWARLPPRGQAMVGARLRGSGLQGPAEALRALPVFAHPAAVPARRDGVLVLMCLVLGWSWREALQATTAVWPSPRLGDRDLPLGADPLTCPSCVLPRWLRVLAADTAGGRRLVEGTITDSDRYGHDCRIEVPPGWQHRPLLPAVDRHGWIDPTRSMGPRSLSTVCGEPCGPDRWMGPSKAHRPGLSLPLPP